MMEEENKTAGLAGETKNAETAGQEEGQKVIQEDGQMDWQKAQDAAEEKAQQDFARQQSSAHDAFLKQQEEAKAKAQAMEEQFRQTQKADPFAAGPSADGGQAQGNFRQAQQNFQQAQQNFQQQTDQNFQQAYQQPNQNFQQQAQQNFQQQASQDFQQPNGGQPVSSPVPEKAHTEAMVSLILGAAALFFGLLAGILGIFTHIFFLFLPTILGIAGLILSSEAKKNGYKGGMQTAGFWLSLIGLILGCLAFVSCGACAAISCAFCHGR